MIRIRTCIDRNGRDYIYTFSYDKKWITYVYRHNMQSAIFYEASDLADAGVNHLEAAIKLRNEWRYLGIHD